MFAQLGLAFFFINFSLLIHRCKIYPMVLLILGESFGLISLSDSISSYTWQLHTLYIATFLAGYFFIYLIVNYAIKRGGSIKYPDSGLTHKGTTDYETFHLWILTLIVLGLVAYHFVVGGIPVLTSEVETARFNFSSSGLFGLPGRMHLFGLPLLTLYISIHHLKNLINPDKTKLIYKVVWWAFIISRLLAGFKSAIIEALVMTVYVKTVIGRPLQITKLKLIFKYTIVFLIALAFALLIAFQYESLGLTNPMDGLLYIIDRSTVVSEQPKTYIFYLINQSDGEPHAGYFFYYINDLKYYMQKYFHLGITQETIFPLDKQVSSEIYRTPLTHENFIVPVTIGAFAESAINLGLKGAFIAMFIFGAIYAWFILKALKSKRALTSALFAYGAIIMESFVTKGNLMYNIVNSSAVILAFLAFNWAAKRLMQVLLGSSRSSRQNWPGKTGQALK